MNKTTGAATLVGASGFPDLIGLTLVMFPNPSPPRPVAITVTPRFTG